MNSRFNLTPASGRQFLLRFICVLISVVADAVVLEECWATGEWFRSGCIWNLDRGRVFYFRPGHETYPVFKNLDALKLIENAVRWLGTSNQLVR